MKALFRTALLSARFSRLPSPDRRRFSVSLVGKLREAPRGRAFFCSSMTMNDGGASMERQFQEFRALLDDSGSVRERIRSVASEIESAVRIMQSNLLLVHHALVSPEVLEKSKVQISAIQSLFKQLSDIISELPGQYYRYHGDWRGETQSVVSSLAFLHWLETENLLTHAEAEEKLGLDRSQFCLDIEDYLIGLCFMSNELPRFVVNQVTAGNYDSPRKVLKFLTDLQTAFRLLNLRNDFLRKKFDIGWHHGSGRMAWLFGTWVTSNWAGLARTRFGRWHRGYMCITNIYTLPHHKDWVSQTEFDPWTGLKFWAI